MPPDETRSAPAAANGRGAKGAGMGTLRRHCATTGSPIDTLLARLERVRRYGRGWRADCPAGHSSRGSLSITEGEGGRVLLHCFSGCSAADVLHALGLELADLFPERLPPTTPEARRELRQRAKESGWAAALGVLAREATLLLVAAEVLRRGEPLVPEDHDRLAVAEGRIHAAREALR